MATPYHEQPLLDPAKRDLLKDYPQYTGKEFDYGRPVGKENYEREKKRVERHTPRMVHSDIRSGERNDEYGQPLPGPAIEPILEVSGPIPVEAEQNEQGPEWEWLFNVGEEHMCIARRNMVTGAISIHQVAEVKTYPAGELPELINSVEDRRQFMQRMLSVAWECGFRPEVQGWDISPQLEKELADIKNRNGQLTEHNAQLATKLVETMKELSKSREAHLQDMRLIAMAAGHRQPVQSVADIAERMQPKAATRRR